MVGNCENRLRSWERVLLHYALIFSLRPISTTRHVTVLLLHRHFPESNSGLAPQGEQFCLTYDANSLIYISKAMDLFDMTEPSLAELGLSPLTPPPSATGTSGPVRTHPPPPNPPPHLPALAKGLRPLAHTPTLILGVQSDILFPVEQQRELAAAMRMAGNSQVSYYELGGVWGHDTFLLDVQNVGGAIRGFLL